MAKPNYSYEKRQRELAKKKKKEEKLARKAQGKVDGVEGTAEETGAEGDEVQEPAGEPSPAAASSAPPAA